MKKRGYLGIDESNHGKYPEIFVAVYSDDIEDIKKTKLYKKRDHENIFSVLGERDFRYSLIPEEYTRILDKHYINLLVFSNFIKHCGDLELVIIDGEIRSYDLKQIERMIYPFSNPRIKCEAKADIKYKIVNVADHIANLLYKHHVQDYNKKTNNNYTNNLLGPNIERF